MKRLLAFWIFLSIVSYTFSQQSYYSDVNLKLTGISLKDALATKIITTHSQFLSYSQIWEASKVTDINPNNTNEVILIYGWENGNDNDITNNRERAINSNGGAVGDWNREHVFSRSLGVPNLGESGPGSDVHHLRPADVQRNSSRNNEKFVNGSGVASLRTNGGWYPGDEWKGDVARMMMYMYLRYGNRCLPSNVGIGNSSSTPDDMIDLFLQWNVDDPVSNFEKQRNTYHENTTNSNAQGNRNPFIDNPRLATRIWGGPKAEDTWGLYSNNDTEAPTLPTNLTVSNIKTSSITVNWTAATDNIEVTSYDLYINGELCKNVTATSTTVFNLNSNTTYDFYVIAKDIADNKSVQSKTITGKTLEDSEAPETPTNVIISNETGTSFIVSWTESLDNTLTTLYEIYVDGKLSSTTNLTKYTITGLEVSTTYTIQVLAKDAVGNASELSSIVNATTTDGSSTTANELFFSEYFEGSFGTNKALEIVNVTPNNIDLSSYSIKRQHNGGVDGQVWESPLQLSGNLNSGEVYVIINGSTTIQELIDEADFMQPNLEENGYGAPINFNGNDPVGLFKNDVLIDIIGTYNGGSSNFAKDKTLRRKSGVSQPNTAFDLNNEWDVLPKDTYDGLGNHNAINLSTTNYLESKVLLYPNPVGNRLIISNLSHKKINTITIHNALGKKVFYQTNPGRSIDLKDIAKGIYIVRFTIKNKIYKTKILKN